MVVRDVDAKISPRAASAGKRWKERRLRARGEGGKGLLMGHVLAYFVAITSMLAGAAVVHNYYQPSLVLPGVQPVVVKQSLEQNKNKETR